MNSISQKYGSNNVTLFILPNKLDRNLTKHNEEQREIFNEDLDKFFNMLNKKILIKDLRECPLDESHFIKNDGHPNELGHQLLGNCSLKS